MSRESARPLDAVMEPEGTAGTDDSLSGDETARQEEITWRRFPPREAATLSSETFIQPFATQFTFLKAFLLAGGGNKTSRYKHKKTHLGHLFVPNNNDRLNVMSNTPCSHIVHSQ